MLGTSAFSTAPEKAPAWQAADRMASWSSVDSPSWSRAARP